ncbi:hypothetical protein [Cupriavidus pauculus]|uniref:DUF3509 domain-containing protein n=1 Tax=Cupriavidus pauculus TaxID=82633 RepID=A0A2N5C3Y2_9BURK|nr:hypothetical protein [Cupriavidus pauculus]PLP96918.1 hypothetical protein CYJ10_29180 [Cupriavidus pauculus]
MAMLSDWAKPVIDEVTNQDVELVLTGADGNVLQCSWRAPVEGRPNRRATPIAIQVTRDVVGAVQAAEGAELSRLRNGLRRLLNARLVDYSPDSGPEPFLVIADDHVLDR